MPREFTVLIAGAGMAGLLLGQLLEKAKISYVIFEKSRRLSLLGSVMAIGPQIMPLFEQLGMMDEVEAISKPINSTAFVEEDGTQFAEVFSDHQRDRHGYPYLVATRADLFNLLLSRVPTHKVIIGKKVLRVIEEDDKVTLKFSDNTQAVGDICIGADGAYSAVRQSLYKALDERGVLPKKDAEDLTYGYFLLLGTTAPLDPEKYPFVTSSDCKSKMMQRSSTKHNIGLFVVPGNRVSWHVAEHVQKDFGSYIPVFRSSAWGSESAQSMCDEVRGFKAPFQGVVGDYIDATPKDSISKVMLEEKLFKTWYGTRTVLVGDAVHKILPFSGQGAATALQDAVVLANCLYDLPDRPTLKDLHVAFSSYFKERYPMAKIAFQMGKQEGKLITSQTIMDRLIRRIAFRHMPEFMQNKIMERPLSYRPQVSFLPMVEGRGTLKIQPQMISMRYLEEQKAANNDNTLELVSTP